jgi:hypothetical protein
MFFYSDDLALRERVHREPVEPSRERLSGCWQRLVARRTREDEPAGPSVSIQLSLDGVEDERDVLVLVDAHRLRPCDEGRRIRCHRIPGRDVVEVEEASSRLARKASEQRGLAHGPGTLQQQDGLLTEAADRDGLDSSRNDAGEPMVHGPPAHPDLRNWRRFCCGIGAPIPAELEERLQPWTIGRSRYRYSIPNRRVADGIGLPQ